MTSSTGGGGGWREAVAVPTTVIPTPAGPLFRQQGSGLRPN